MRVKLNQCYGDTSLPSGKGYIEKLIKEEVDFLLAPSIAELKGVDFQDVYIENRDAEEFLEVLLKPSFTDKVFFLTGMTGTGKSMLVRKVFQTHSMTPLINHNTLVIPISFDNITELKLTNDSCREEVALVFANMIGSACELLEQTYTEILHAETDYQSFYDFISSNRGDIAKYVQVFPRLSVKEKLSRLAREHPLTFSSAMLKYYINQSACTVSNVVFVLDDVEGIGEEHEIIPVKIMYEVMTCMQNHARSKKWTANALISCRHYVYRIIKFGALNNDENGSIKQIFETYTDADMYHIDPQFGIKDIVSKRYAAIIKQQSSCPTNKPQNWKSALDVVQHLIFDIDKNIGDFILNLNMRNIRTSLATVKKVVYNRRWIQRDYLIDEGDGAFKISNVQQFQTHYANLIRAIGMGESISYNSSESVLTNLLINDYEGENDLFVLLTLKYFVEISGSRYSDWNNSIDIERFYEKIREIFGRELYADEFKKALHHLLVQRMLLRSIDQLQTNTVPVNTNTVDKIRKVYISNAAIDLWRVLGNNSAIFEMYIDDIWIDLAQKPTSKKPFRGFDIDNFDYALKYLERLIKCESLIRRAAENTGNLKTYTRCFGSVAVTQHLLNGLQNSLKNYYKVVDTSDNQLNFWNNTIKEYYKRIQLMTSNSLILC